VAGPHGQSKTFFSVYLICDGGGYHRWPYMVSHVKAKAGVASGFIHYEMKRQS
jgi:hypothetical protein